MLNNIATRAKNRIYLLIKSPYQPGQYIIYSFGDINFKKLPCLTSDLPGLTSDSRNSSFDRCTKCYSLIKAQKYSCQLCTFLTRGCQNLGRMNRKLSKVISNMALDESHTLRFITNIRYTFTFCNITSLCQCLVKTQLSVFRDTLNFQFFCVFSVFKG